MSDYSIAIKIGAQLEKNFNASIRAAQSGLTGLEGTTSKGAMASAKMSKSMAATAAMAAAAAKGVEIAGKVMVEVGKYSVQVGKDFESAMSSASATASATTEEYTKMKQAAMDMGRSTSKTATESAQALEYMALAGWDVDTSISALPSVLKMSEASGMDLGRTSDLVTDSMAALGVTVEQLPEYLDVATKAQNKSNQTAEQLMEAYLGVGGTMKNLNVPIAESATALGVLANRGIKGSEAGNALNAVMVNLTTRTGQAGKKMQDLGVSAFDSQGNFIGLEATLQQLNTSLQGCSEEERNAALAAIGGKQHVDALNNLMAGLNTTNEEGVSEWAALTSELENCNGSLQAMRDMKLDNLEGDLAMLDSATQDAGIKIYKHLNGPLRDFAQFGTQAVYQVSDALESDGFSGAAGAAGSAIADGLGMVMERLPEFLATATVSVASFLVGFAADLPASLLTGIVRGTPRLLKALPGLGINIVKAIIRGILSMGSAPLKAIKSLIFGGGNDTDAKEAGAETAQGYAAGIGENIDAAANTSLALPQAPVDEMGLIGAALPAGRPGMLPVDGLAGDLAGQVIDIPNVAADTETTAMEEANNAEALKAGAETGTLLEIAQPAKETAAIEANTPAIADTPSLQAVVGSTIEPPEAIEAETQAGKEAFVDIPAKAVQLPVEIDKAAQISTETTAGIPTENTQLPPDSVDKTGLGKSLAVPPVGMIQETAQLPPEMLTDTSSEAVQTSMEGITTLPPESIPAPALETTQAPLDPEIPLESAQTSAEEITGAPPEPILDPAEAIADASLRVVQVPVEPTMDIAAKAQEQASAGTVIETVPEAAQIPSEAMHLPAEVTTGTGQAGDMPETASIAAIHADAASATKTGIPDSPAMAEETVQNILTASTQDSLPEAVQALPVGMKITGIGDGIAQARNALQAGVAGQAIDASEMNVDSTALSNKMGIVGALGGQSLMDGIGQNIGGIVDVSQVGVDTAGITRDETVQAAQLPPQDAVQPLPQTMTDAQIPPSAGEAARLPVDSYTQVAQTGAELQAVQKENPQKTGISQILPMLSGFLKTVSVIGSANIFRAGMPFDMDTISSKMQSSTQAIPTQPTQNLKNNPWGLPEPGTPDRDSIIGKTIDSLSRKSQDQETSASGSSPQIIYNPIFNIKGSGDVKEDVEKANRMGMREFEELMEAYLKKNKRVKFG